MAWLLDERKASLYYYLTASDRNNSPHATSQITPLHKYAHQHVFLI